MTNSGPRDLRAVAMEFATALDLYEATFAKWVKAPEFSNFRLVDDQLGKMRALRNELPELASELVKLVIAHADWSAIKINAATGLPGKSQTAQEVEAVRVQHNNAVKTLRARCRQLESEGRG